jgi:hypothetical protein
MSPARKINVSNIIRKNDSFDFTWSFHPIFVWMRIVLGIELSDNRLKMLVDIAPFRRRFCRWISRFFWGFLVLVVSLSVNILDAIFTYDDTIDSHYLLHEDKMNNVTVSDLMIIRIAAVNEVFYNGTIHLIFYSLACCDPWKELWATLQKIQFQSPKITKEFYFTCRKISVFGVICIFVVIFRLYKFYVIILIISILIKNCGLNVRLAINHLRTTESIDKVALITSLSKLSETLSLSILVLLSILVWSTIYLFRFVNLNSVGLLTAITSPSSSSPSFSVSQKLENWRRFHVLICQLVDRINSCFGFILLVAMTHGFISFISDSFEITMAFSNHDTFQTRFLIRFCQHFALLFAVCYSSYRLQSEVI